jgi:DNA replication protein DnaC
MRLIDDKNLLIAYTEFAKSGYYFQRDLQKLPEDVRIIIETDRIIKSSHLTHRLLKELFENQILKNEPKYKRDSYCEPVIDTLCQWLRKDDEFLKLDEAYNFEKGLLIHGFVGCGKTLIMRGLVNLTEFFALNGNVNVPYFRSVDSYEIAQAFAVKGYEIFESRILWQDTPNKSLSLLNSWLFIDDIGSESVVSHYGNSEKIIGELLTMRYSKRHMTAGTTNLDVKSLKEFYGERVFSRMREKFNFIHMDGNDRRN